MTEKERMLSGKLYNPYKVENPSWIKVKMALKEFNDSKYWYDEAALKNLKKIFHKVGNNVVFVPPFFCDHGDRIFIGDHFFANTGLVILDEAPVWIGNHVYIAPRVSIYTAGHPVDAQVRNMDLEYAKPVTIGNDVWIGGDVVINPGVTIGNDVVIGAGSVVTKDISNHVIAAGNPCRVIRKITDAERQEWRLQYHEYQAEVQEYQGKMCN